LADFRTELRTELAGLRTEVRTDTNNLGAELYKAMADQTRTFVVANVGMILSGLGLAFAAARFAGH
jgi:hypothetical protein